MTTLIWNLQTYTEADPMDPTAKSPDDDFARKCLRLRDRVLANMDPRSLRVFREEFDFFNNFTVLSGKLMKVEGMLLFPLYPHPPSPPHLSYILFQFHSVERS